MAAVTRRLCAAWRHVAAPAITGARLGPGADRAAGANPVGGRAGGDADRALVRARPGSAAIRAAAGAAGTIEGRAGVLPDRPVAAPPLRARRAVPGSEECDDRVPPRRELRLLGAVSRP